MITAVVQIVCLMPLLRLFVQVSLVTMTKHRVTYAAADDDDDDKSRVEVVIAALSLSLPLRGSNSARQLVAASIFGMNYYAAACSDILAGAHRRETARMDLSPSCAPWAQWAVLLGACVDLSPNLSL